MTRWARVARGTIAATVSLFIAAFSHWLAGGSLPGVAGFALCLVFSVLACVALVGRRMPRTRLAASIVASQAMYHGVFASLGSSTIPTAPALGHVHDAPIEFGAVAPHLHASNEMLLAHAFAAVVTFVILAFGERSIAATAGLARSLARSLFPFTLDASFVGAPATLTPTGHRIVLLALRRVDHSGLRHRGPPAAALA